MAKDDKPKPAASDMLRDMAERLVDLETVTGKLLQRVDKLEKVGPVAVGGAARRPWN